MTGQEDDWQRRRVLLLERLLQFETAGAWHLLGTDLGTWTLKMPRTEFMAIVKKDLESLRAFMG